MCRSLYPSLSGITNGTGRGGSMDWQNATRARLHLETVREEEGAPIACSK
jgi:hypothetical protein